MPAKDIPAKNPGVTIRNEVFANCSTIMNLLKRSGIKILPTPDFRLLYIVSFRGL